MTTPYEEGPLYADLVFVAEAPANIEMIQGRPLVGPSGKLFNQYLRDENIIRSDCLLMNVSRDKVRDIAELMTSSRKLTEKGLACQEDLKQRLKRTKPHTIVALGDLAKTVLTGDRRTITRLRGSPLECSLLPGVEVIPTIHPAATLPYRGNEKAKYYIMSDFRKALRHSERPGVIAAKRELLIEPTFSEAMNWLKFIGECNRWAFDIEVYNHQVSCISYCADPSQVMSIPFYNDYWTETQEAQIWRKIGEIHADRSTEKCGTFLGFDISFLLYVNKVRTRGRILCTFVAHKIMYPDFPASLEFVTSLYTDEPYYKDDKKIWNKLDQDIHRFWRYNCKDSACSLETWNNGIESDLLGDEGFLTTYNNAMESLDPCLYMMTRGIKVNRDLLEDSKEEIERQLKEKEAEFDDVCEIPINHRSSRQVINYFYILKGLRPYLNTKTHKPTCDDKALSRIIRRDGLREARVLQELRSLTKYLDTYLEMQFDPDNMLRCFYNVRGTRSGRLSSSKTVRDTGLNMQNLHPAFKYFLVPG